MKKEIISCAVVILNYKNKLDTHDCVVSILKYNHSNIHIIVCDNDSRDDSFEYLESAFSSEPTVTVLQTGKNGGFAWGNNVGIKYCLEKFDFEYIWLLNNDTILLDDAISKQISHMKKHPDIGILGVNLVYADSTSTIQACAGSILDFNTLISKHICSGIDIKDIPNTTVIENDLSFISGASMFVSKDFLLDTGFLNEKFFLYFEEADWVQRMDKSKYRLGYCRDVFVIHKEGASIGSSSAGRLASPFSVYHICRSRLIFCGLYFPKNKYTVLKRLFRYFIASFLKMDFAVSRSIFNAVFKREY